MVHPFFKINLPLLPFNQPKMNLLLQTFKSDLQAQIAITGSKSETNRLLLLQALFPNITLANTSNSADSEVMQKALKGNDEIVVTIKLTISSP